MFCASILVGQNTLSVDTLWIQGEECYFYADAQEFNLQQIQGSKNFLVRNEFYFDLLLDRDFKLISTSPYLTMKPDDRPTNLFHVLAFSDSLYFHGWETYRGIASIPQNQTSVPCDLHPKTIGFSRKLWRNEKCTGLTVQSVVPMSRKDDGSYWLYFPTRIADASHHFKGLKLPPFVAYRVAQRKSAWTFKKIQLKTDLFPFGSAAFQTPDFFGSSVIAFNSKGMWWAEANMPFVYFIDENGNKRDSVLLATPEVHPDSSYKIDNHHSPFWHAEEMRKSTSKYTALYASESYLFRLVWVGPKGVYKILVHECASNRRLEIDLPSNWRRVGFSDDKIFDRGVRVGARIAFPFLKISDLLANASEKYPNQRSR
jgi:hypothetical protein